MSRATRYHKKARRYWKKKHGTTRPWRKSSKRSFRKKRGFVKRYKKAAYMGHRIPRFGKIFMSNSKRNIAFFSDAALVNGAYPLANDWIMMPVAGLVQQAEIAIGGRTSNQTDRFTGSKIWLTGISLDFFSS